MAFVGLGSNLDSRYGSPRDTVQAAMTRIATWSAQPLHRSSLWQTDPIDCPPGSPQFINAVVGLVPAVDESPHSLLERLLALEQQFGRRRSGTVNAARSLDLDLISFGARTVADVKLRLPHPEAHRRGFVLLPLAEIAPDLRLAGQSRTVAELVAALPDSGPLVVKIDS
jgi:2-amino-4-hydroxy-6-hydroxymethyldihydropteridine diphosphokinase